MREVRRRFRTKRWEGTDMDRLDKILSRMVRVKRQCTYTRVELARRLGVNTDKIRYYEESALKKLRRETERRGK